MPGWEPGSWGYHGDDGKIFWDGQDAEYGPTYGAEDVVGCGVDFTTNSAFFTKNGRYLGKQRN
jgi:Ran-binding protein 9/10